MSMIPCKMPIRLREESMFILFKKNDYTQKNRSLRNEKKTMTHNEIKEKIIGLCSEIFQNSGIDADILEYVDFSDDLGMDSIVFITLIVEIEMMFDITVPDEWLLMDNFKNVDSVFKVVAEQLAKKR